MIDQRFPIHHIPLIAAVEIEPPNDIRRVLDRDQADAVAGHLAADLARLLPEAARTRLVVAGTLFEPAEVLQPGFPAWQAITELSSQGRLRDFSAEIVAFGARVGRMPHTALQPPDAPPQGRMLVMPMVMSDPADASSSLESRLEAELFERGSIDPPARAALAEATGVDVIHAQCLTRADLLALHQVQLDSAGLGGFWPLIEHALLSPDEDVELALPGGLRTRWQTDDSRAEIEFVSFDQSDEDEDDYVLWLRALRSTTALLDAHGIAWRAAGTEPVVFDPETGLMIETAGSSSRPEGLTVHHHPELGLVAWSLIEDGRLYHLYPLDADCALRNRQRLEQRMPSRIRHCDTLLIDPDTGRLQAAPQQ